MEFRQQLLSNGLEVIAEVDPHALSLSLGFFVNTGARDEASDESGLSHFLEHMLFKGTDDISAADLNRRLDDLASQANAYTSEEQTVYYATVLPGYQSQLVSLLTAMMRPALRNEDFEVERQVILEEIAMYDDQPPYGAMEELSELYFESHPLANRILGTKESIAAMRCDKLLDYFDRHYAANQMKLVATGNVDFQRLVEQLEQLTQTWQPSTSHRTTFEPTVAPNFRVMAYPPAVQQYTFAVTASPARNSSQRFAYQILAAAMGDDSGSRYFWEFVDPGLAESAVAFTQEFADCGWFGVFLACPPEDVLQLWPSLLEHFRNAQKHPFTEDEIQRAINKVCSSLVMLAERPSNRLFTVGEDWTFQQRYETVGEKIAAYQAVTADHISEALECLLTQPLVSASVGPNSNSALERSLNRKSLGE